MFTISDLLNSLPFHEKPRVFISPARINIIGEHVDYLGGLVLPAAIDLHTQIAISPIPEKKWIFYSLLFHETVELEDFSYQREHKWVNYILGVLVELQNRGIEIPGLQIAISGNIPHGAGLSSSASLEVGIGFALSEILGLGLSRKEIALIGQKAENEFVGMKCGIMDQFVIANGKKDSALLLNTSNLEFEYKNINLGNCEFYLIDSKVKHALESSDYNVRRKECELALTKIREKLPTLPNLYFLPINQNLDDFDLTNELKKRVKHVIGEKKRTEQVLHYLNSGRPDQLGTALYETHASLSNLYEVSCPETDFLVDLLKNEDVIGARMIGGGFGGCVLVLDKVGNFERISNRVWKDYYSQFGIQLEFYRFQIDDGVRELEVKK